MPTDDKPNYGIDAPGVVATFALLGIVFLTVAVVVAVGQGAASGIGPVVAALFCFATAGYMVRSSKIAKRQLWQHQLDLIGLTGDEHALDVGCGRGLVTVELAKRLPEGEVVGVDIWRRKDQSGNDRQNTERNLVLEGVGDRVEIADGDMTALPFDDDEFDVVTASLAIHNIALAAGRRDAMHEIMRVTRPGGRIVIMDIAKTSEYLAWLTYGEWDERARGGLSFAYYPPVRTVTATKPGTRPRGRKSV